ncbi:hypothetical protein BDZ94DRAFT_1071063 [Collybia nuda]|uniref:Uncharacterized protein n=1 Tax=Collybia nuda TaxID=64659 RepID=A0A9P5XWL6_9AGAR|nr:hypothetical protein BDZ94DRAFT_1071063 [Collybia nuda]
MNSLKTLVYSFNSPPLHTKIAFACALPIIAEHLSILWNSASFSTHAVPPTITLYQHSPCHSNILGAVNKFLHEDRNLVSKSYGYTRELSNKLLPIVVKNRLDKSGV